MAAERKAIAELVARVAELERSGLDLGDEDPLPEPGELSGTPVGLSELQACLAEELDVTLDGRGDPAPWPRGERRGTRSGGRRWSPTGIPASNLPCSG